MASKTAQAIYTDVIRKLPLKERLRLAALILNEVAPALDEQSSWSEEDIHDLMIASLWYARQTNGKA